MLEHTKKLPTKATKALKAFGFVNKFPGVIYFRNMPTMKCLEFALLDQDIKKI